MPLPVACFSNVARTDTIVLRYIAGYHGISRTIVLALSKVSKRSFKHHDRTTGIARIRTPLMIDLGLVEILNDGMGDTTCNVEDITETGSAQTVTVRLRCSNDSDIC
jgi:hypothetical protein